MIQTKMILTILLGFILCTSLMNPLAAQNSVDPQNVDVVVTPDEAELDFGAGLKIDVFTFTRTGNREPVPVESIDWQVTPDSLGRITDDGFFMAGNHEGKVVILVRIKIGDRVLERRVLILIRPRVIDRLFEVEVVPPRAVVPSGGEQQFEAIVTSRGGVRVRPDHIRWAVRPDGLGRIGADGLFVAGEAAQVGKVIALVEIDGLVLHGEAKVAISVPATGAIAGQVTKDADGLGIEGAKLRAVRLGDIHWVGTAEADADGNYLIDELIPGFYVVHANARAFIGEYYDDTRNYLEATILNIAEEDTARGINFGLSEGGKIQGSVVAEGDTREPLAGAHVSAFLIVNPRIAHHAVTNVNGNYTVESLATGTYGVRVNATGYRGEFYDDALRPEDLTPVPVQEPNTVAGIDFVLDAGSAIGGVVREDSQERNPIARAHVIVFPALRASDGRLDINRRHFYETRTDENGEYLIQVRAGLYYVFATATGFNGEYFDDKQDIVEADVVEVLPNAHTQNINFALGTRGSISGQVTDQVTGLPIAGAIIEAFKENARIDAEAELAGFRAKTDDAGNYVIENLPAGKYLVVAKAREYLPEFFEESPNKAEATLLPLRTGQDTTGIDFTLEVGGSLAGFVGAKPDSLPLRGALVQVFNTENNHSGRAYTDDEGNYVVPGLPTGEYIVHVLAEGMHPLYYDDARHRRDADPVDVVSPNSTSEINLYLSPIERKRGTIAGQVVSDESQEPLQGAVVVAVLLRDRQPFITFTGPRGHYELTDMPAGKYFVFAWARGFVGEFFDNAYRFPDADPVFVESGQVTPNINFDLRPQRRNGIYVIRGRIRRATDGQPLEGVSVFARVDGEVEASAVTDSDGRYVMEGLTSGTYRIEASGIGYSEGFFGGTNEANATTVPVGSGSDAAGVDIDLEVDNVTSIDSPDDMVPTPEAFDLSPNYPNPFNPQTTIRYQIGQSSKVTLKIFNVLGQEIRTLVNEEKLAGSHSITWNGKDAFGRQVASGIYIFRIAAGDFEMSRRMLLLK